MLLKLNPVSALHANGVVLVNFHGLSIKGSIAELGKLLPCRVRLFEKSSGHIVSETLTNQNGFYEFNHLVNNKYFVVAHHPASQFNAVIQDNVVPK